MKLKEILSILPYYTAAQIKDELDINSIEMDHRKINTGDLFVCIKGFTVDGHQFANQAIENGAIAIIAEQQLDVNVPVVIVPDSKRALAMLAVKFYDYPTNKLSLIGVTGTNGKTTTTYILEKIFNKYEKKTGLIGTIQMKIGEQTFPVINTTPDALLLQKTFRQMVDYGVDHAIMEVSSHALDLGRVYGCNYDIAVFTNLSQDHLDYHKDMDDYLRAKSLLFAQLGNGYQEANHKFAIINEDDASSDLLKRSTAQQVITYGCDNAATIMAKNITLNVTGTCFDLHTPLGIVAINSSLIGKFNVYNMLAASAAAIAAKVPLEVIKEALEQLHGVSGRFEPVVANQDYAVIVDYSHTPDSLENVLQTIKEFAQQNVYVVVGCGGDRDRKKRPLMAQIAVKYADQAFFTSDNPRTEDPESIIKDMTDGLTSSDENFSVIPDRREAIKQAISIAKENDIILIAGKGHETYQQIGHVKYDFDDRQVAKEAIITKEK